MAGFKKGQSGNPGGRPKIAKLLAELGLTTSKVSKELIEFARKVIGDDKAPLRDRIRMWEAFAPHVIGKPKETFVHEFGDGDGDGDDVDLSALSNRELDEYIARMKAEATAAAEAAASASSPTEGDGVDRSE